MSCSNGTHASRQFLSFLRRWRQPQPRNRSISKEEERQPRAPPLQLPRLTQRLPLTQRPHRARRPRHRHRRQEPRRRWPLRALRRTSPHRVTRLRKRPLSVQRHNRSAPRRDSWPGPPAGRPPRPWHDTRRRRELPRPRRSNSRKLPAAAAGVERDSPNRPSLPRAPMSRAHPRRRAPRRRWALRRRALRQQRTSDAMGPRSKM